MTSVMPDIDTSLLEEMFANVEMPCETAYSIIQDGKRNTDGPYCDLVSEWVVDTSCDRGHLRRSYRCYPCYNSMAEGHFYCASCLTGDQHVHVLTAERKGS